MNVIAILLTLGFLAFLSLLPLFLDPYYHRSNVNFWDWAYREFIEVAHGEKE